MLKILEPEEIATEFRKGSAYTWSSGRISHESAPVTEDFDVNSITITERSTSVGNIVSQVPIY